MPTSYSFSSLIKACTWLMDSAFGKGVHGHNWKHGFDSQVFVQTTTLVEFYSTFNSEDIYWLGPMDFTFHIEKVFDVKNS